MNDEQMQASHGSNEAHRLPHPRPDPLSLSSEQQKAVEAILDGRNIAVLGPAGTGKSVILQAAANALEKEGLKVTIVAPTGIAADAIGGVTLHKAFSLPPGLVKDGRLARIPKEAFSAIDALLIDEVSMVGGVMIELLWQAMEEAANDGHQVRIAVFGDFFQLEPTLTSIDMERLKAAGLPDIPRMAFEAAHWDGFRFEVFLLEEVRRQSDVRFVNALGRIREGHEDGLRLIKACTSPSAIPGAVWLCSDRKTVDRINGASISALDGKASTFKADVCGSFAPEKPPALETLTLKPGVPALLTINDPRGRFRNGTRCTIRHMLFGSITVSITDRKDGKPHLIRIQKHTWTEDGASFTQYPIIPAFAITIHRAQGMTLDSANLIPSCWAPGQLYTALSRVRDPSRLYIEGAINPRSLICSTAVLEWHCSIGLGGQGLPAREMNRIRAEAIASGGMREGLRFGTHTRNYESGDQQISRTFIVLRDWHRHICGVTNFAEYLMGHQDKPITSDVRTKARFVVLLLNYAFIDAFHIGSLEELDIEIVRGFLQAYASGAYGKGRHTKETIDSCVGAIGLFLENLTDDRTLAMSISPNDLRTRRYTSSRYGHRKAYYSNALKRGLSTDCVNPTINRDMPEAALRCLLSRAYTDFPDILMNIALGLTACLRPSETCSLDEGMLDIAWSGGRIISVKIDLTREVCIRSDSRPSGKIKKHRAAHVQHIFLRVFQACYERAMSWRKGKCLDPCYSPLSIGADGMAMTFKKYYLRFRELVRSIIPDLKGDPSPEVRRYARILEKKGAGPHICRHMATVMLACAGYTAVELMDARGDSSPESAMTYLEQKGEMRAYYSTLIEQLGEMLEAAPHLRSPNSVQERNEDNGWPEETDR